MLSERVSQLSASGIRRVMAMALEKEQQGGEVIHMEVGQPHFDTPEHIVSAVAAALSEGVPGYTPNLGLPTLREAVAERTSRRTGQEVSASMVGVTSGAVMALALAIQATVDPGDEVLVPDPGWPNYRSAVAVAGGQAVGYHLDRKAGFALDPSEIEARVTPQTRMIIVNSPANPTGVVAERDAIRALLEVADRHGLYVLSDEIYEDIVFRGAHHSILMDGVRDNAILVSGVSKSYAMTGWRIGWLVGAERLIQASSKLIEPLTSCPVTVSQIAAEAAIRGPQDLTNRMRETYGEAFGVVNEVLGPLGVLPTEPGGAFYLLLDISTTGQASEEFVQGLLEEQLVAVAPGSAFGATSNDYVRLSTALAPDVLERGCRRIRDHIKGR